MPSLGPRCHELRVRDGSIQWRILLRTDTDAILILEVFAKKTARAPKGILEACRQRMKRYDDIVGGIP
jgi:phage-related protein